MSIQAFFAKSVSALALISASVLPGAAFAQDGGEGKAQAEPSETAIIVTGSRIRGIEPTGSPVIGLSREEMELSAAATTTELLSELPQVFNLGANDASFTSANNQNANRTFGTGINLRGLGTESTLTLVDSRRVPGAGTMGQYFDPSVIPTAAIARLEVLADGSSGIYGSDAVGGVVNIILRKDLDGADLSGRVKFADGMTEYQLGGAIGTVWDTGSIMVAGEYTDREGLFAADREYYTDDLRPYGGADLRSDFAAPGNVIVDGVSYAIPSGQDGTGLTPGDFAANTRNLRSIYDGTHILPPQERYGFAATFEQEIASWIKFYARGVYAHRSSDFIRGALTTSATVPVSNPYYVNPGNPGSPVTVRYAFTNELGTTLSQSTQKFYHGTAGLEFDLGAGWSADAFFSYGKNEERSTNPTINAGALNAALTDTNPSTALNLFSANGNNNPATIVGLLGEFRVDTDNILKEYGISFDGPLFALPGGDLRVALGAARQETRWIDITPFPSNQTRDINSVFGEVFVPLIGGGDGPELNFSAALRHDDYENIGSTTNPKLGLTFRPVESVSMRASFGKSFRAPTLADTGNPFNIATNFNNETNTGTYRVLFIRGGNTGLQPEEATTWSAGVDFEPVTVPGLRLSATYYNVKYTNRIATPGNDTLAFQKPELAFLINTNPTLDEKLAIINGPGWASPPEDPAGIYAIVDGRKVNVGRINTEGLEFLGDYRADTDWGGWRLGFNAAWIMNFERALTPSSPLVDIVDTINNPRGLMARAYAGVDIGRFGATLFANHQGGYDTPTQSVPSHTEFDLALRYELVSPLSFTESVVLSLDVQDLFDNDPPIVINGPLPFDSNSHSSIGRTISLGLRARI